jgi:P27 family predicted phage terminase small subunit
MGRRGPKTQPAKLKLLSGETHRDRIPSDEPVPADEPLTLDAGPREPSDEVQAVWDKTVAQLESMGLAYAADSEALRAYCEAVVQHRRASAVLKASGVLVQGLHGNYVRNPALQVQRDTAATMLTLAREFGLTPSARTQIGLDRERPPGQGAERLLS